MNHTENNVVESKKTNLGYALLGFFLPLLGFVLYFVMKETEPVKARSAGKWAVVSSLLILIPMVLMVVMSFILALINSQSISL